MTEINHEQADNGGSTPSRPTEKSQTFWWGGLVAAAVLVALWNWDGLQRQTFVGINNLGGEPEFPFQGFNSWLPRRLTPAQRLLLEGDTSRTQRYQQQRAIWEAHPTNRVYLGNYITALQTAASSPESIPLDYWRSELAAARKVEPGNARFDYLEAGRLLNLATTNRSDNLGTNAAGEKQINYRLEVLNRAQLDQAMVILRQGLGKPYWRRYAADMLGEQLAVLGSPRRLVDLVQRTALAASVLLPDLAQFKTLAHSCRLYAELLIADGKSAEAIPFLDAWQVLAKQLTKDSFTLIDLLVAGAIVKEAEQSVPPIYRRLGREADAQRTEAIAAAMGKPVQDWRAQRDPARRRSPPTAAQQRNDQVLHDRAGILAAMLLPALGEWPEAKAYEPGRMLEYVVFTEVVLAATLVALLGALVICGILAWRWRAFRPANEPPPPRLMPVPGTIIRIQLLGVLLPLVLFFLVTRYLPESGHAYSIRVGAPKLMAEFGLLMMALLTAPICLTVAQVKRQGAALGFNAARWHARFVSWPCGFAGVLLLILAWCLPVSTRDSVQTLAFVGLGFLAVSLVAGIILGLAQGVGGDQRYGQFYGSVFRTLVPMLALTIIVLGIATRPFLVRSEACYLDRDTLMQDRERVGFTRLENNLVQKLRTAMLENLR
jgi:hypothetical protein